MSLYGLEIDPLDATDFDPVQFINQKFPSEKSLDDLDTFVVAISSQIATLDEEISKAVQSQSVAGQQASKVLTSLSVSCIHIPIQIAE